MRLMSFSMTTPQILARTKTVTRRLGWRSLHRGDVVQAIEKGQGLRKGEHVVRLAVLRIIDLRHEMPARLVRDYDYGRREVILEGFPDLSPDEFVTMFCDANDCQPTDVVRRIEFEYLDLEAHP